MTIFPIPEPEDQEFHHPGADALMDQFHSALDELWAMHRRGQISEISAISKTVIIGKVLASILAELGGCTEAGQAVH